MWVGDITHLGLIVLVPTLLGTWHGGPKHRHNTVPRNDSTCRTGGKVCLDVYVVSEAMTAAFIRLILVIVHRQVWTSVELAVFRGIS